MTLNNGTVVILRGAQGSGKSTFVEKNFKDAVVCSADHFCINSEGVYDWKPEKVSWTHKQCQEKFFKALTNNEKIIVVDNTNIKVKDFKYYYENAKDFNYNIRIVRISPPLDKIINRNVHGVPEHIVKKAYESIEDIPKNWDVVELLVSN